MWPATPLFENFQGCFRVTVYSDPEETSEKVLFLIKEDEHITISDLASRIKITKRSIEGNIKKLQSEGELERIGPDTGGHWKVKDD